jgi:small subunit ribosomal protein S17
MADDIEETTEEVTEPVAEAPESEVVAEETPVVEEAAAEPVAEEAPVVEPVAAAPAPKPAAAPVVEEDGTRHNGRKVREGLVVSDAMQSTIVVAIVERTRHPRYGKTVQRTKKLYVHDAEDTAKVGDRVRVQETRPLSKLKRWRLTEVVERAR